jgi:hypothetical protein
VTAFELAVATPVVLSNRRSVCLTWLLPGLEPWSFAKSIDDRVY